MNTFHYCRKVEEFTPSDKSDYSTFKHGCKSSARKFGKRLAESFLASEEFERVISLNNNIVICAAPHNNIITASFALKDYFVAGICKATADLGIEIEEAKVSRKHTYTSEYGEMTSEERNKVIAECDFYVDPIFLKGKHVIFIDDCRISGAHESGIERMVRMLGLDITYSHVYYAALIDKSLPTNIEDELNNYCVKTIEDILTLILYGDFVYNTRVIKKILRYEKRHFELFLESLTDYNVEFGLQNLDTLLTLALLNNYHKDESMTENMLKIRSVLNSEVVNKFLPQS